MKKKCRQPADRLKFTSVTDSPDMVHAKNSYQPCSDKAYKASADQGMSLGYDLRLDAIPFQTAKASREIASDLRVQGSLTCTLPLTCTLTHAQSLWRNVGVPSGI
ncbi:unnamed protein product [Gadus morhua 'NCC']